MWVANTKILLIVVGTLGVYTAVANLIPRVGSAVRAAEVGAAEATEAAGDVTGAGTPQEKDPRALVEQGGCIACHQLEGQGGAVGPSFEVMGEKDEEYIRRGIVSPNADTAKGFEAFAGTMPSTFGEMFTAEQIDILVKFLKGDG